MGLYCPVATKAHITKVHAATSEAIHDDVSGNSTMMAAGQPSLPFTKPIQSSRFRGARWW